MVEGSGAGKKAGNELFDRIPWLHIVVIIAILGAVNFLSTRHFARTDLTSDNLFTISDSTVEALRSLDDLVHLKVYFSKKLPENLIGFKRQVKDTLDEYRAYAGGNLKVEWIDPSRDEETERKVRTLGIPPLQLNIREKDKIEVQNVYLGMATIYEDKKEIIPTVTPPAANLEYNLTSAILKVTADEVKRVGILVGSGDFDYWQDLEGLRSFLEQQYRVQSVDTSKGDPVPAEIATLIVVGTKDLKERDCYEIDQFLMKGGKLILLHDGVAINQQSMNAVAATSPMNDMLVHYGVRVNGDLVYDRVSNQMASFRTGFMTISQPYPLWVKVRKEYFNEENPIVNRLDTLILPWTSSLEILHDKPETVEAVELATSTEQSGVLAGTLNLSPQQPFTLESGGAKPRILAAMLEGAFPSFYVGKEIPKPEPPEPAEGVELEPPDDSDRVTLENSMETEIVLVGSSRFAKGPKQPRQSPNQIFLLNAVDHLTMGEKLIGIRSRVVKDRPLEEISENARSTVKYGNIFGVPLLIVIFGVVKFTIRRKLKNRTV